MEQSNEKLNQAEHNGLLTQIRGYLEAASRIPYELSDTSRGKLVDEFVQTRQNDASFTAEDFQVRLTVSLNAKVTYLYIYILTSLSPS